MIQSGHLEKKSTFSLIIFTGNIITAIGVINGRIDEMVQELTAPFFEDEDRCPYSNAPDPDAINFDIPKEDDSDDYDTFDSLPG